MPAKDPAAALRDAANRLNCTLEIEDSADIQAFTIDIWAPTGYLFSSNGSHVLSYGYMGHTGHSKELKDRIRGEALADLTDQAIEKCEDDECEYCHAE